MSNIFSKKLKEHRLKNGLKQKDLAKLLSEETGIAYDQRNISFYEANNVYPKGEVLPALAKILNVSLDELFGLATPKQKEVEIDITEIIGITKPQLYRLSKQELQKAFEKYLNYLEDLQKSKEWLLQKVQQLENRIQELESHKEDKN